MRKFLELKLKLANDLFHVVVINNKKLPLSIFNPQQKMLLGFAQENLVAKKENKIPPHTIIMVTHELHEAIYVCDRVIGLSQYYIGGHNGATIIYDKPCPDFLSRKSEDLNLINAQKQDLRNVVFSEELVWPDEHVRPQPTTALFCVLK